MIHSSQIGQLATALAKAQAIIGPAVKNKTVHVRPRSGKDYDFSYTTLDQVIETVRAPLTSNGLWFLQTLGLSDGAYIMRTMLTHESGEWIGEDTPFNPTEDGFHSLGSAITYMRRYTLCCILGLAAEEDDDANAAEGNSAQTIKEHKPANDNVKRIEWTGSSEPTRIDAKEIDAISWCQLFLSAIKQTTNVDGWIIANEDTIDLIGTTSLPIHKKLIAQIEARRIEVSQQKTEQGAKSHQPPSPDNNSAADNLIKLETAMAAASSKKELNAVYASHEAVIRVSGQDYQDAAVQLLLKNEARLQKRAVK